MEWEEEKGMDRGLGMLAHTRSAGTELSEVEIYSIQGQSVLHGEIFSQETKRNRIHMAV